MKIQVLFRSCCLIMLLLLGIGSTLAGLVSFGSDAARVQAAVSILAAVTAFGLAGVISALETLAGKGRGQGERPPDVRWREIDDLQLRVEPRAEDGGLPDTNIK